MRSGSFSWVLASLTRGSLKVVQCTRRLHGLQTSPVSWLSGDEFWRCGRNSGCSKTQRTRSLPVAALWLQWLASEYPLYSRAAATDLHRLPEHEVCGDCGGHETRCWLRKSAARSGRVGVNKKTARYWIKA